MLPYSHLALTKKKVDPSKDNLSLVMYDLIFTEQWRQNGRSSEWGKHILPLSWYLIVNGSTVLSVSSNDSKTVCCLLYNIFFFAEKCLRRMPTKTLLRNLMLACSENPNKRYRATSSSATLSPTACSCVTLQWPCNTVICTSHYTKLTIITGNKYCFSPRVSVYQIRQLPQNAPKRSCLFLAHPRHSHRPSPATQTGILEMQGSHMQESHKSGTKLLESVRIALCLWKRTSAGGRNSLTRTEQWWRVFFLSSKQSTDAVFSGSSARVFHCPRHKLHGRR